MLISVSSPSLWLCRHLLPFHHCFAIPKITRHLGRQDVAIASAGRFRMSMPVIPNGRREGRRYDSSILMAGSQSPESSRKAARNAMQMTNMGDDSESA
jgi:hypothetical protein